MDEKKRKYKDIGERVREIRKREGFKQKPFSKIFKISRPNLSRIEGGEVFPNFELLRILFFDYDVSANWLLFGIGPERLETTALDKESILDFGKTADFVFEMLQAMKADEEILFFMLGHFKRLLREGQHDSKTEENKPG